MTYFKNRYRKKSNEMETESDLKDYLFKLCLVRAQEREKKIDGRIMCRGKILAGSERIFPCKSFILRTGFTQRTADSPQ